MVYMKKRNELSWIIQICGKCKTINMDMEDKCAYCDEKVFLDTEVIEIEEHKKIVDELKKTNNKRFSEHATGSEHIDKTAHYKYKASKQVCIGGVDMRVCMFCKENPVAHEWLVGCYNCYETKYNNKRWKEIKNNWKDLIK